MTKSVMSLNESTSDNLKPVKRFLLLQNIIFKIWTRNTEFFEAMDQDKVPTGTPKNPTISDF